MKATFVELPAFERHRAKYLDDAGFSELQLELMRNPEAGDVIEGTGGLRKLRFMDKRRGKGKRGGLRVIITGGLLECSSGYSLCSTRTKCPT
jgi:hypothetical protein